jgi:PAS domain S-box-containing protein
VGHPEPLLAAASLNEQRQVLGRAAQLLASAAGFHDTLRQTIRACLPALADFGFFDVVTDKGVVRTIAAHEAPDVEAMLAPTGWVRQQPRPDGLNLCALSSGQAALHPLTDDAWYRAIAASEGHLALLQALAFRSMITVPVRYQGELLGALTLFMGRSGRNHNAEDLAFAQELAVLAAPVVANARLAEQHRRAEERLRMAVEAGQVGIWDWDMVSNGVEWSDRVYEMHGVAPGSDTGGLEGFRSRVHPQDWGRVHAALTQAIEGGPPYAAEFRTVLPDGSIRWIATRSHLVRAADGKPLRMVGASIDVTQRMELLAAERRARDEAEAARKRMELLASAGSALARSLDPDDTLQAIATTVVPAIADWCRIDLLDDDGVLRRRMAHHADPVRGAQALEMAQTLRAAPDTPGSMAWCVSTGQSYYGRFDAPPATDDPALRQFAQSFGLKSHFIMPLVARGRTIGAMGVVQAESGRDLSEADRALVRELGLRAALALDNARLYAEAAGARRQAEAANRAKDEFLAMLGHELRNPLAPIATALELMARRDAHVHVQERNIVARQVSHLSRLIDDLLDVSRITQGKIEIQRAAVDLQTVVANALEQTQPLFDGRPQAVQLELAHGPAFVEGDAVRLTQVLCNLLVNAAKFTPRDKQVSLQLVRADGWVEVAVRDQGQGIAADLLSRVFDLFVQGSQGLDRQAGGLGLGLAIVRMLVELHGGTVSASSPGPGQGACFTVRLPARGSPQGSSTTTAPTSMENTVSGRILIVDDNTDAAETLGELLRMVGHQVRCAAHGTQALQLLQETPADLALLDIGLPDMDGYELASRIRAMPGGDAMKLVALTGYGADSDRARAKEARFDEHLVKPVNIDQLLQVLERMLPPSG